MFDPIGKWTARGTRTMPILRGRQTFGSSFYWWSRLGLVKKLRFPRAACIDRMSDRGTPKQRIAGSNWSHLSDPPLCSFPFLSLRFRALMRPICFLESNHTVILTDNYNQPIDINSLLDRRISHPLIVWINSISVSLVISSLITL